MIKRLLCAILALVLCIAVAPTCVQADEFSLSGSALKPKAGDTTYGFDLKYMFDFKSFLFGPTAFLSDSSITTSVGAQAELGLTGEQGLFIGANYNYFLKDEYALESSSGALLIAGKFKIGKSSLVKLQGERSMYGRGEDSGDYRFTAGIVARIGKT